MKTAIKLILLVLLTTNAMSQDRIPLVTDHYDLKLSFNFADQTMQASCVMTITNQSDAKVNQVPVLLYRLMNVESVSSQEGQPLPFRETVSQYVGFPKLQVNWVVIDEVFLPNETKTIHIEYSGFLLGYSETGMRYITDRISPEFTLIRNDAYSYPVIGIPDITSMIMNAYAHFFEFDIEVTVPDTLVVANGGHLVSLTRQDGLASYRYRSKIPNWRIDIAIGPYKKMSGGRLEVFYLSDSLAAASIVNQGVKAMELYHKWWGDLQNDNTITVIETERGSGGQADETTILLPQEAFVGGNDFSYLYHEISHLWNVRISEEHGPQPRWYEGLATFCESFVPEKLSPEHEGLLKRGANNMIRRLRNDFRRNPALLEVPMVDFGSRNLTRHSYTQPMVMFAVMYYWLGEETFNHLMGGFYQEYQASGASTRDFTNYCIEKADVEKLKEFFDDWVYTTNYTKLILDGLDLDAIVKHYN